MNKRPQESRKQPKDELSRRITAKRRPAKTEKKKGPTATIIPGVTE